MNKLKLIFGFCSALTLMSCDALLLMTYTVENKSRDDIRLFVPNCPIDSIPRLFGPNRDTILILKPNEKVTVGIDSKLDFPWATRNIYKANPGICGIQKLDVDTTINFGCSTSEWKYERGTSNLKVE